MYGVTEGDNDTPREDSPVIFVISEKFRKVHPYQDWVSSNKGAVEIFSHPMDLKYFQDQWEEEER